MKDKTYKEMKFSDILAWCMLNNEKAWLSAKIDEKRIGKNGEERAISFIEVKRDFCAKFFPEKLPVGKPKPKTMRQMLDEAL